LERFGSGRISLTHYAARGRQARHCHDHLHVSFLLAGSLSETLGSREYCVFTASRGAKPAGVAHGNEWGSAGALILSLKLGADDAAVLGDQEPGWSPLDDSRALPPLVRCLAADPDPNIARQAAWDLLAIRPQRIQRRRNPPLWLLHAREILLEGTGADTVAEAARQAGIHRVHLSRSFQAHFGCPPSLFRRGALLARAVDRIVRAQQKLSVISCDTGFFDQAHLTRRLRGSTGLTPDQLRRLFRHATSVQD
jgi:AraC family transcriptional regulator